VFINTECNQYTSVQSVCSWLLRRNYCQTFDPSNAEKFTNITFHASKCGILFKFFAVWQNAWWCFVTAGHGSRCPSGLLYSINAWFFVDWFRFLSDRLISQFQSCMHIFIHIWKFTGRSRKIVIIHKVRQTDMIGKLEHKKWTIYNDLWITVFRLGGVVFQKQSDLFIECIFSKMKWLYISCFMLIVTRFFSEMERWCSIMS